MAQAPATKGHRSEAGAMLRPHLMLTATAGGGDDYDAHFTDGEPGDQRGVWPLQSSYLGRLVLETGL